MKKTALHDVHEQLKARMVDFAGWHMPLHYGSQLEEHHAVRNAAGVFDVSHMLPVDLTGIGATRFLQSLLAGDVARLAEDGKALYTVMLNEQGGILDDLIVYRIRDGHYRAILNAGAAHSDVEWIEAQAPDNVSISARHDLNILAVQGPQAVAKVARITSDEVRHLRPFTSREFPNYFIGRTGYTGEDGVEVLCDSSTAESLWSKLLENGIAPCGLGARDTLRLEAGLNLYGQDMSPETTPLNSALAWVVHWEPDSREFIGRAALEQQRKEGPTQKLTGIVLTQGIVRPGQSVQSNAGEGTVTSGSYSPTLGYSVGLARVPQSASGNCTVSIRNRDRDAKLVKPPFVRKGRKVHK